MMLSICLSVCPFVRLSQGCHISFVFRERLTPREIYDGIGGDLLVAQQTTVARSWAP